MPVSVDEGLAVLATFYLQNTNPGHSKFYVIQLLREQDGGVSVATLWGKIYPGWLFVSFPRTGNWATTRGFSNSGAFKEASKILKKRFEHGYELVKSDVTGIALENQREAK